MFSSITLLALAGSVSAGTVLWDGRLNGQTSSAFLNDWSFSNEVGPYQYYIHGSGPVTDYVNLAADYKNPADTGSKQGIQITIDQTSVWNSDNMLRTELIPQTSAAINKGKVAYHFSMQHTGTNPPSPYEEHQVCFFESHFTEMKYGLISGEQATEDLSLQWYANSQSQWNTTFTKGVWHNIAYEIDFDAGSVTYWHSTGAADLVKTAGPVSVSASSNGADWHLGVLRLPSSTGRSDTAAEDWHFSGVYIESGDLTTSVSGPGGASAGAASSVASEPASSTPAAASSVAAPATSSKVAATSVSSVVEAASSTYVAPSSTAVPTISSTAAPTSAKPTSSRSVYKTTIQASPSSRSSTTLSTVVKPTTASSIAAPVESSTASSSVSTPAAASFSSIASAASSLSGTALYSYGTIPLTYTTPSPASTTIVQPTSARTTSSSSVTATVSASSSSSVAAPASASSESHSHYGHSHHPYATGTSSSAAAPISTEPADGECVVEYVYA